MLKLPVLLLIFSLFIYNAGYSQDFHVSAKIVDRETKLPIPGANISVSRNSTTIFHTISDSIGKFKIPWTLFQGSSIKISSLNYDAIQINANSIKVDTNQKNIDLGTVEMYSHSIELKEVLIKSRKRYRDTSTIDLSKKNFERSIMIDDLFSRDIGFTKDANGQLYYKGKPVSGLTVNGGDFFGKNNLDIYKLLPALTLRGIKIIETNIDSTTNTTLLKPVIKVNLELKDKYDKGLFGNANIGIGTNQRYIANTSSYGYKDKEQLSLNLNSNNINMSNDLLLEPRVDFSANGNNLITHRGKLMYRNVYADKAEIIISATANDDHKSYMSESERQEENINEFSKTFNSSNAKSFNISDAGFKVNYKIDSLSTLNVVQGFKHNNIKESDSLNYLINIDSLTTSSQLNKQRVTTEDFLSTDISFQKKFGSKKGKSLNFDITLNNNQYRIHESDNVNNFSNQIRSQYFINGDRHANEDLYTFNTNFTEPLSETAYINFFTIYKRDRLVYKTQFNSDTTLNTNDAPFQLINNYIKPGIKFGETFNKVSLNAVANGDLDLKDAKELNGSKGESLFNLNATIDVDYKINARKSLTFNYSTVTNYPGVQQLTSLGNTFDLVSQISGNLELRPEEKRAFKLYYTVKSSDSENISISGEYDNYHSKFGYSINSTFNNIQNTSIANIGNSNSGQITFFILKNINDRYLSYSNSLAYQETPTLTNNKLILNNGITFNQSLTSSFDIIKSVFSASPILASSFSKYFYESSTVNVITFTYSDKLSFHPKGFLLNFFPLFNYSHSLGNNRSFSVNGEIKKSVFKTYGAIWLQAYDIFNSFKFYNNYIGSSYYQSVKYSNIHRYFILGLTYKFNNMK